MKTKRAKSSGGMRAAGVVEADDDIVTVRPDAEVLSKQRLPYFIGISAATARSKVLSMNLIVIPPAGAAAPHLHAGQETAIYILKGRVKIRYGRGLRKSSVNQEGDFLFIPPYVSHQPVNMSATEVVCAIVARNDPNEQEHVFLCDSERNTVK